MTTIMKNEPHCLNCGETKHQYANNCECGKFVCGKWMNPYYGEGEEQEDVEILDSQEQPIGVAKNQEEWDTLTAQSDLKMERTTITSLRSRISKIAELEKELAELREWNAKMNWNQNEEWCRSCGAWEDSVCKAEGWGYVCEDCLHHLDNEDHERCEECDGCKECGCDCDDEE
jgi:hypothetical protein